MLAHFFVSKVHNTNLKTVIPPVKDKPPIYKFLSRQLVLKLSHVPSDTTTKLGENHFCMCIINLKSIT